MSTKYILESASPEDTQHISGKLAYFFLHYLNNRAPKTPLVITLEGDLGAGKTHFARAFIHTLYTLSQVDNLPIVPSPTYTILHHYPLALMAVTHVDCYRLHHGDELDDIGLRDYLSKKGIVIVEWASKITYSWGGEHVEIVFLNNLDKRLLQFNRDKCNNSQLINSLDQWLIDYRKQKYPPSYAVC